MASKFAVSGKRYLLAIGDIAIFYYSLWLTLVVRYGNQYNPELWRLHFWPFTVVLIVLLAVLYIDDLYEPGIGRGHVWLAVRILRGTAISGFIATTFFYIGYNRLFTIQPQRVLLIHLILITILAYLWRIALSGFARSPRLANGVLFIGASPQVIEVVTEIEANPQLGYKTRGIVQIDGNQTTRPDGLAEAIPTFNQPDNLATICAAHGISTIVSTAQQRENPQFIRQLFNCLSLRVAFFDIATFYERIMGKIPVTSIGHSWFLENFNENNKRLYENVKIVGDFIISILLLILSLPFLPFISLAVAVTSPGPILFRQERVGKGGKPFRAIKFRSMVANAESNGPQWATKNDQRVTRIGRFMRKTRIDEIPQLINVIRGEMSLIGPRPERPEFVRQLEAEIPFYTERLLVKPGLTGWAQVAGPAYGGSVEETIKKLQYDFFYIKNRSLALDVSILLKTIRTVLRQQGQ